VSCAWRHAINLYLTVPLLTGLALIQSTLLSRVSLWGARPDLILLVVLIWAFVRNVDEGLVWGFIGGLVVDLLSGGPLGGTSLALLAAAFLAGQSWGQGLGSPVARLLILALAGVVVYHLVLLIVMAWTGHAVDWGFALLRVAGPSALLNILLAPFLRQPLAWLERKTRREVFTL
jgi:rod shape-determining protein MreD